MTSTFTTKKITTTFRTISVYLLCVALIFSLSMTSVSAKGNIYGGDGRTTTGSKGGSSGSSGSSSSSTSNTGRYYHLDVRIDSSFTLTDANGDVQTVSATVTDVSATLTHNTANGSTTTNNTVTTEAHAAGDTETISFNNTAVADEYSSSTAYEYQSAKGHGNESEGTSQLCYYDGDVIVLTYTLTYTLNGTKHSIKATKTFTVGTDTNYCDKKSSGNDLQGVDIYVSAAEILEEIQGALTITKVDGDDTSVTLPNAVFTLYEDSACKNAITTYTTGSDGTFTITISTDQAELKSYLPAAGNSTTLYLKETTAPDGYSLSDTVYNVIIGATSNSDYTSSGSTTTVTTYTITLGGSTAVNIENSRYDAKGSIQFSGTKSMTGRALKDGDDFTYTVKEDGETVATGTSGESGDITFGTINYTLSDCGTHTYTVTEDSYNKNGITSDTKSYTVTVKVSDNGDGTLKCEASDNYEALNFTNTYDASGDFTIKGTKSLTGRTLKAGEFSFTLTDEDGNTETVTNDADGNFSFSKISVKLADLTDGTLTKTYTISEDRGSLGGITYDTSVKTVKVVFTDNGDGTITGAYTDDSDEIKFTNAYHASGKITLEGTKTLTNRALSDGEFSFAIMNEESETVATGTNDANGKITFTALSYDETQLGTHTYTVKETSGDASGVTVDTSAKTISVTVKDNGDGTLSVTSDDDSDGISFANTYTSKGQLELNVHKTFRGRLLSMFSNKVFTFYLTDGNGTLLSTTSVEGAGENSFDLISYTDEDMDKDEDGHIITTTKTYSVYEGDPNDDDGITYDSNKYTVTVTLTDDGQGNILASVDSDSTTYSFTNVYSASGSITFSGSKTMTGRALTAEDKYSFTVNEVDENGTVITSGVARGYSDEDGNINFETITYKLDEDNEDVLGDHYYTVSEDKVDEDGVTSDTTVYTVKVSVTNSGQGVLNVVADEVADSLNFTNTYQPDEVKVVLKGTKSVVNGDVKDMAGKFTFLLLDENADKVATAVNAADGTFAFDALTFSKAGTYKYTISEVSGGKVVDGITYDDQTINVTITVTDDGKGTLTAKVDTDADVAFTNTVNEYTVSIDKTDNYGNALADASLVIYDADKNIVNSWTTDGTTHSVALKMGTYTLHEVAAPDGYEVAEDITFNVTSDGQILVDEKTVDSLTMVDKKILKDVTVVLKGTKTVANGDVKDMAGKFTFILLDENADLVSKAVNTADGTFGFDALTYTQPGTYNYTISEVNGGKVIDGITYDNATINVTVTVTDDNGTLKAEVETDADVAFTNTVNEYTVTVNKTDEEGNALADASLVIYDADKNIVASWTTDGNAYSASLKMGTYTLHEVSAPEGYDVAEDITFSVTSDGQIVVNNETVEALTMVDVKTKTPTDEGTNEETPSDDTTPTDDNTNDVITPDDTPSEEGTNEETPSEETIPTDDDNTDTEGEDEEIDELDVDEDLDDEDEDDDDYEDITGPIPAVMGDTADLIEQTTTTLYAGADDEVNTTVAGTKIKAGQVAGASDDVEGKAVDTGDASSALSWGVLMVAALVLLITLSKGEKEAA